MSDGMIWTVFWILILTFVSLFWWLIATTTISFQGVQVNELPLLKQCQADLAAARDALTASAGYIANECREDR